MIISQKKLKNMWPIAIYFQYGYSDLLALQMYYMAFKRANFKVVESVMDLFKSLSYWMDDLIIY